MNIDGIDIEIERKPIKNMHLSVYPPDGRVHLSIPDYLADNDAKSYIISKWEWITKKRDEIASQERQTQREYVSGENHYLFGERYLLRVAYTSSGANTISTQGNVMTMNIRQGSTQERRAELMAEWYRSQLKEYVTTTMDKWMKQLDETEVAWQIKTMKTMWGSCNAKKRSVLLNLELARVPKECIDYVIVHELTHLKVQSHNKLFEALMTKRLPGWRHKREKLNSFIALPI